MNKKLLIAGAAITSVSISTVALAVDTATGLASAEIVAPVTIATGASALAFGDIVAAAGTVIITPLGAVDGASTLPSTGTQSNGTFTVTGEPSKTYSIGYGSVVNLTNGTDTIPLSAFTDTEGSDGQGAIPLAGTMTLGVGATITLPGVISSGTYNGSYVVTVDYD